MSLMCLTFIWSWYPTVLQIKVKIFSTLRLHYCYWIFAAPLILVTLGSDIYLALFSKMWVEVAYASSRQVFWKLCGGSPGLLPLCDKARMFLKELFLQSWFPNEGVEQSLSHLPVNNWQEQEVTIRFCQPLRFGEYLLSQQNIAYLDETNDWKALHDLPPTFFPSTSFFHHSFSLYCTLCHPFWLYVSWKL